MHFERLQFLNSMCCVFVDMSYTWLKHIDNTILYFSAIYLFVLILLCMHTGCLLIIYMLYIYRYIYMCTTYTIYTYSILHTNILKYMYFMIMHISIIIWIYILRSSGPHKFLWHILTRKNNMCWWRCPTCPDGGFPMAGGWGIPKSSWVETC